MCWWSNFNKICRKNKKVIIIGYGGAALAIHYVLKQKGYKNSYSSKKKYQYAEQVSNSIIALPFYPEIEDEKISIISNYINDYFSSLWFKLTNDILAKI